jgi:hypothetical protein
MGLAQRLLWLLTVAWGSAIPWMSTRPPLIDLPQHAGQIALLSDYFSASFHWISLVSPNFFTPYLTTYGLIFILHQIFSITIAIKIILSLCFLSFVGMCFALRKELNSNPQLDWLFLIGYFGYAWTWGFISFLIATPISLLAIWTYLRFLRSKHFSSGLLVTFIGSLLLISHGLMFGCFFMICSLMLVQDWRFNGFRLEKLMPLLFLIFFGVMIAFATSYAQTNLASDGVELLLFIWNYDLILRLKEFLTYPFDQSLRNGIPLAMVILVIPFLLKLRFCSYKSPAFIPFIVLVTIFFLGPTFALKTQYLYQRFAIFLFPFFAFLFIAIESQRKFTCLERFLSLAAKVLLIGCIWFQFWTYSLEARSFSKESAPFEAMIKVMNPHERALYLPINAESDAQNRDNIYLHYGQWYQAEKGGFVDFNFAWFPVVIMRFNQNESSPIKLGFEWEPIKFDWQKNNGELFKYFIIKSKKEIDPADLFKGAACIPTRIFFEQEWQLFEKSNCQDMLSTK